jgi:hypothetical protein
MMRGAKVIKLRVALIGLILTALITPSSAFALEQPRLTWERGRVQTVTLGGGSDLKPWMIFLQSQTTQNLISEQFVRKESVNPGFFIYSILLTDSFPLGDYAIIAMGDEGSSKTTTGFVKVIDPITAPVAKEGGNSLLLIALLIIFSVLSTVTLRRRKEVSA